jgi:aminoglycoside 6'-N-acetyltransferase
MTAVPGSTRLRAVHGPDQGRIRQWLRDPHVQRWWGNTAAGEAKVAMALDTEGALCRVILADDEAIGYAHAFDAAHLDDAARAGLSPGTFDCDLFIAVEAYRGKGHGQRALQLLVDEVFATTLAVACSIIVSVRNERAVRAYEAAGFKWTRVWRDPVLGPSWVMVMDRPRR